MVKNNPKLGVKPGLPADWISDERYQELRAAMAMFNKEFPLRALAMALAEATGAPNNVSVADHLMRCIGVLNPHVKQHVLPTMQINARVAMQREQSVKRGVELGKRLNAGKHANNFELRRQQAQARLVEDAIARQINDAFYGDTPGSKS